MRSQQTCAAALIFMAPALAEERDGVVEAKNGLVVSVSAPASEVGDAALQRGGTAVATAVTHSAAGNLYRGAADRPLSGKAAGY